MPQRSVSPTASRSIIVRLATLPRIDALHPVAARCVYAMRLIGLHERARRDPVPELATRLGSVEAAAKALAFGQAVAWAWPEDVHLTCFCSPVMTHDEATIATMIEAAARGDVGRFEAAIAGLVRPDRVHRLMEAALAFVAAEMRAS